MQMLINAQADLILVARAPSDDELNLARDTGVVLDARPVALDAFVFVLNKESPMNDLSIQEIQGIYTGKITDWEQLGGPAAPIQPYQREENSGSQELMQDLVMKNLKMIDELGGPNTFNHYAWGRTFAGNTPFRRWKRETYRGGISDPFIVHWPEGMKAKGEVRAQYAHAIDMVPSVLEMLGIE